ncbi:helix-turn-helix transcriptional regulator [Nonomuraea sp. NPDC046802]|uniref:helix-turn-helix domain-containing protein n=1 Tax=Nonomuraea sp. NPDC046802 TaxID=3154919 RepID=UPI0033FBB6BB
MSNLITFGQRLRHLRREHNVSQGKLARELGLSGSYISFLESGTRQPSAMVLHRLAAYFDVEPVYLRYGTTADQAVRVLTERREAAQQRLICLIGAVFEHCTDGDVVTFEMHTMDRDDQQITTLTLVKELGSIDLASAPDRVTNRQLPASAVAS